jgi:hypothetical protein
MEISEKKLYCVSVNDPNDFRLGMRKHVVADSPEQACEKVSQFFKNKHIPHAGLRDINTISSQCII